ncbi:TPA: hypothetical protein ACX6RJ_000123 [Photobacterium damselae]|uniref:hypothetical protein n=1 Tax=Photobacterium damselae TaxID=38293 RepID=UPI0015A3BA29|nr:hypothetical protein [Photobacterium damselae]NVO62256.1 hypothetical protein [Photobacterium damselae subsp. damselae]
MEFSFDFANRLINSAELLIVNYPNEKDTDRTVLYLSCLSCEISLKAILENAGYSEKELRACSHNLSLLLKKVTECEHDDPYFRTSSILAQTVRANFLNCTVGTLLRAEDAQKASTYPNKIRYGEQITHYPHGVMLDCAKVVSQWCRKNHECIKKVQ